MTTRTYQMTEKPLIRIIGCNDNLEISGWDEKTIEISADSDDQALQDAITRDSETLSIEGFDQHLRLRIPHQAGVEVEEQSGSVNISEVATVGLTEIAGDVDLHAITGDVNVRSVDGNLAINQAGHVVARETIAGNASISHTESFRAEEISGDLRLNNCDNVAIDHINGNAVLSNVAERCHIGRINGDLTINEAGAAYVGQVRGNLAAQLTGDLRAGEIGGDCTISSGEGNLRIGLVRGNLNARLAGLLQIGQVQGDAAVEDSAMGLDLGKVHGNLALRFTPAGDQTYRANVSGDALVSLQEASNLTLHAVVKGDLTIAGADGAHRGNRRGAVQIVFGTGEAQLHLTVGGDLALHGAGPTAGSAWTPDLGDLTEEMGQFGWELAEMGREIAASFAGTAAGWAGKRATYERDVERARRRAEREAERIRQRVERAARKAEHKAKRVVVPGFTNIRSPMPPVQPAPSTSIRSPTPPVQPASPTSSIPANNDVPSEQHENEAAIGPTVRLGQTQSQSAPADEERLAILHMLAEGHITSEEAEELLAALDSRAGQAG
jgi:DUF4097 and DUF4098 domain-containing protein YvlB